MIVGRLSDPACVRLGNNENKNQNSKKRFVQSADSCLAKIYRMTDLARLRVSPLTGFGNTKAARSILVSRPSSRVVRRPPCARARS
jgi:hypothetical protein